MQASLQQIQAGTRNARRGGLRLAPMVPKAAVCFIPRGAGLVASTFGALKRPVATNALLMRWTAGLAPGGGVALLATDVVCGYGVGMFSLVNSDEDPGDRPTPPEHIVLSRDALLAKTPGIEVRVLPEKCQSECW